MSRRAPLTTRQLTRLALLGAAAAVLGYFDSILSALLSLPLGVKLGLANTAVLYAIYLLGPGCAVLLMLLKVTLTGLMSGNLFATFTFSMAGSALSLAVMLLVKKLGGGGVSIVGVSVAGAAAHAAGQLLAAVLVLGTPGLMFYIFPLLIGSVITGILTGLAGQQIVRVLRAPGAPNGRDHGS